MSNYNPTEKVNEVYLREHKEREKKLKVRRKNEALPPLTPIQDAALVDSQITFACYRGIKFLWANQGSRTDVISPQCAIGNLSDTFIGFEKRNTCLLDKIGLRVVCERQKDMNRYGMKTVIGIWWLTIADQAMWEEAQERANNKRSAA
jgi:hypothetical protein